MQRFVPCAVAALAMLPLFLAAPARAQPVSLTVELAEYSLSPNGIEVALGEQVQILVINNGSLGHTFVIESYANYDTNITPGAQTNVFFTADAAGTSWSASSAQRGGSWTGSWSPRPLSTRSIRGTIRTQWSGRS